VSAVSLYFNLIHYISVTLNDEHILGFFRVG